MRISARNILKGKIVNVVKGQTSITNESVDDLGLKKGMAASAVIKSSDVMVAVD